MSEFTAENDPAEFTVDAVVKFLATAPVEDVARVLAAEGAGKARKGITGYTPVAEHVPADEDGYTRVLVEDAYQPGEPVPEDEPQE